MKRPNVLLMITDQQSYDTIAAGGHPHMHTPNLDRLASEGTLFTQAFCNSPVCMPSRQSLFSGQYPGALNLTANGQELPEDVPLFHEILKPYGYRTANIGKLHFRNIKPRDPGEPQPDYGFDRLILSETIAPGFHDAYNRWIEDKYPGMTEQCRALGEPAWEHFHDGYCGFNPLTFQGPEDATHACFVADEINEYIRQHSGEKPWFASAGFFYPHDPVTPPERFLEHYEPEELPAPHMTETQREKTGLSDEDWKIARAHYYALCSHIDEEVGRILDELERTGQREDTIVIFTSDHGSHMGEHGMGGKTAPGYDSCSRVPLVMSYPGRIRQDVCTDQLVELVDLAPTVLELCGAECPPFMQGQSLVPLLTGEDTSAGRDSAFMEIGPPGGGQWKSVRTPTYYFAVSNEGTEELYDLDKDPHQLHNIAGDPDAQDMLMEGYRCLTRRIMDSRAYVPRFESCW